MNTTEMLAQLRLNTLLEDGATDYPDAVLLRELTDSLTTKFQDAIVGFRNGTWQASYYQGVTTGQPTYRLPDYVTVLGKVEIGFGSAATAAQINAINFVRLPKVDEGHTELFDGPVTTLGQPRAYVTRGNSLVLLPTPDNAGYVLRVTYYRKPSRLMPSQNLVSGTDRGRITAINVATRTITINAQPFDMSLPVPATFGNGIPMDIVRYGGWFDPVCSSISSNTFNATSYGFNEPVDLRDVQVGDYVRRAGQTDWPMLPEDFHRCVVDVCSAKLLIQRGYQAKAANYAGDVTADMERFENLYSNRTREEPRIIRAPLTSLRRWWRLV
jgi:hypothetical protein